MELLYCAIHHTGSVSIEDQLKEKEFTVVRTKIFKLNDIMKGAYFAHQMLINDEYFSSLKMGVFSFLFGKLISDNDLDYRFRKWINKEEEIQTYLDNAIILGNTSSSSS